jgi:hypothetical protein
MKLEFTKINTSYVKGAQTHGFLKSLVTIHTYVTSSFIVM